MRKALTFWFLLLTSALCHSQSAVQYSPVDFIHYTPVAMQVAMQPLWNYASDGGTNIVHGGVRSFSTGTIVKSNGTTIAGMPGTLIVSNVLWGAYKVQFMLPGNANPVASFTNVFTNNSPAFLNGNAMFGVSTNSVLEDGYAYTIRQVKAMFETNNSGGGGSGITLTQGTNIVNGSTGVIETNGAARGTTFQFSTTGNTAISALAAVQATAATNGYPWGALYDALNAALNATNGIGISSGLSAFRSTNTFITPQQLAIGSNNVNAANLFGTIPHGSLLSFVLTNNWQGTLQSAGLRVAAGQTNDNLTASTDLEADANKKIVSIANGTGVKTNNGSGAVGWNFTPQLNGVNLTNLQPGNIAFLTNTFSGTTVDFANSDGLEVISANKTFAAVANVTPGMVNVSVVRLIASSADRTVAFPVNWHTNLNFIGVITNGFEMDLMFTVLPGVRTNVAQIPYP